MLEKCTRRFVYTLCNQIVITLIQVIVRVHITGILTVTCSQDFIYTNALLGNLILCPHLLAEGETTVGYLCLP